MEKRVESHSVESHSEEQTMSVARRLGEHAEPGDIFSLSGELGTGKTHFVKGFARAFGIPAEEVNSPTFSLIQEYQGKNGLMLYHFDCFRLERIEEALEIGSEEYFYGDGVSIIEWPEKIEEILPEDVIRITLAVSGKNSRIITIIYPTEE
ncbi:MAG: tRNA (adenosine(37)-N6)-threonylcarbamoyltransferase complex ATPase subunit type 1 TsaE [Balneolaceae bacterium]